MSVYLLDSAWSLYKSVDDQIHWSNVLLYGGLLVGSYLLYKFAVEPFISPLRKIPGMSYNPLYGNLPFLTTGEAMDAAIKMIETYGPVVRYYFAFGGERLGIADVDIIRHILITNSRNYVKPQHTVKFLRIVLGEGLLTSEGDIHAIHKRLMSPAFNNQSIAKLIPTFNKRILDLKEFWKRKIGTEEFAEVSIATDIARTTLDIIGETAFGYDFHSLEDPDSEISKAFQEIISISGLSLRIFISFYFSFPFPASRRLWKNMKIIDKIINNIIQTKRELLTKEKNNVLVTKDVLGMMMIARDPDNLQGMSNQELRDQIVTLLFAGHETTAVALSWCLLMLASNVEIQEKARQEVLLEIPEDEPLTFENLEKLKYCGCIVKETLRMFPPVPITIRQSKSADVLPGGYKIPGGTISTLLIGAMMRRPEIFEDPNCFRPERFEVDEMDSAFHGYLPFLIGTRMCLGYKFALLELRAMLAILLGKLRFDAVPGMTYKRKANVTMKPDPPIKLRVSLVH